MLLRHQVPFVHEMIAFDWTRDSAKALNNMNLCNLQRVQHPENLVHLLPKQENENFTEEMNSEFKGNDYPGL